MKNVLLLTILGVMFLFAANASADLSDGLVAYWSFDESTGSTAYDSANGHDGTIYNATHTTGIIGNALNFDGNNDYVRILDHSDFDFPAGFSLCAWAKPTLSSEEARLVYRYDPTSGDGYCIGQSKDNSNSWGVTAGVNGSGTHALSDVNPVADQWVHIAGVRADNGDLMVYVDGVLQTEITNTSGAIDSSGDLFIGIDYILQNDFMGVIDEVRIYNRPLSAQEINQLTVPEPSTILLLLTGAIAVIGKKRK